MPTIQLTVPKGAWNRDQKKTQIVTTMTEALTNDAKETDKGNITPFISVQSNEANEGGYAVGGKIFGKSR